MRAVVTAGGTTEPIDDARWVTNFSTGRFGAALANALVSRGVQVDLLAAHSLAGHPEWIDPRVRVHPFGSVVELREALDAVTVTAPQLLFMAAAVSDYAPIPVQGKIRSDAEELVVRMIRNPKILPTLRDRCPDSFLCGFKLLSGVSATELVDVARRQIATGRLDLCLANDLAELGPSHPAWIVDEAHAHRVEGSKAETAAALVDHCLARLDVAPPPVDPRPVLRIDLPDDDALFDAASDAIDGRLVATHDPQPFIDRGWRLRPDGLLEGPADRDDLRLAASIALWHAPSRSVLLGRRTAGAWLAHWAFPGGGVEAGESMEQAARRELTEETGLVAPEGPVLLSTELCVGNADRAWRLVNIVVAVPHRGAPHPTVELEARWIPLDEAMATRPMAVGTRRVLRRIAKVLGG